MHSFTGTAGQATEFLSLGLHIGFAGMVTFKRYEAADLVRSVPLDRLLVETDSPYLAPVPRRGKRNEPAFVIHTAQRIAELRGDDPVELARATSANAREFFRLQD